MKKSFSLIEILVAVAIISVVGLALLQSGANNTKLINYMNEKKEMKELFSIVLLNSNEQWHNREKTLYDFVSKKFNIDDDDIRKELKEIRIDYKDDEFSRLDLFADTDSAQNQLDTRANNINTDKNDLINTDDFDFKIVINQVFVKGQKDNAFGYTVKLEQEDETTKSKF
ncbi:MAG: type II secretion system protein [Campylobacterales bacterium]|nr:type II secretion system protein [Campylobacterales bacterium]